MNQQPDQSVINIFAILFAVLTIYYAATSKNKTNIFTNDMVDILYEVESKPIKNNVISSVSYQKIKPKKYVKTPKPIEESPQKPIKQPVQQPVQEKAILTQKTFTELHHDCVNALMSLGMKKRESVNTVIRIFNNYEVVSIEDFIKKAFVPDEYYRSST